MCQPSGQTSSPFVGRFLSPIAACGNNDIFLVRVAFRIFIGYSGIQYHGETVVVPERRLEPDKADL
jgi:hypothetical protein